MRLDTAPHVVVRATDLASALDGRRVAGAPGSPGRCPAVASVEVDAAPVEPREFDRTVAGFDV